MYTQCSTCDTVFRLSAEALRAAGGQVRCGQCGEVFSALARLAEDASSFSSSGETALELEVRADRILETVVPAPPVRADAQSTARDGADDVPEGVEIAQLQVLDLSEEELEAAAGQPSMEFTLPPGELDRIFVESKRSRAPAAPAAPAAPIAPLATVPASTQHAASAIAPASAPLKPAPVHAPTPSPSEPDEEDDALLPSLEVISDNRRSARVGFAVSEEARRQLLAGGAPQSDFLSDAKPPVRSRALWAAAAIVAALALLAQIVHQNREWLVAHGPWGGLLRTIYSSVGAPLPLPADLSAYQLRQWGVTGDPEADGTLRVRASILNTAPQLEPYPLLRVTLANRFGGRIGAREFEPAEYMGRPTARMLLPNEAVDVTLTILDPGKDAEGFEIDVCLRGIAKKVACANDAATTVPKK